MHFSAVYRLRHGVQPLGGVKDGGVRQYASMTIARWRYGFWIFYDSV